MRKVSLSSLSILLAAASCVPPTIAGASREPASVSVPLAAPAFDMTAGIRLAAMPTLPSLLMREAPDKPLAAAPAFAPAGQGEADAVRALDCLTAAIYYEARSEPVDGQRAVAQVVLNRVRSPAFPASVCGVVYQRNANGCQFTFVCDGSTLFRREPDAWDRARGIAQAALAGDVYAPVGSATYYHTTAILPWWSAGLSRVATIGAHIFYRWRSTLESALAFRQTYSGVEPDRSAIADTMTAGVQTHYGMDDIAGVTVHRGTTMLATLSAGAPMTVRVHHGEEMPTVHHAADDAAPVDGQAKDNAVSPEAAPSGA